VQNYLDRPPKNDGLIFWLWASHKQALAVCHGEENTSPDSLLTQVPTQQLYNLAIIDNGDLPLSNDRPLIAIQDLQSMNRSISLALSGSQQKLQHYTPPHLRVIPTVPRPTPQPEHKKALACAINHESVKVSKKISFHDGDSHIVFGLKGVVYTGDFHYTARVCINRNVWFHDGMVTGKQCKYEGRLSTF
jgi:hypothetical protein